MFFRHMIIWEGRNIMTIGAYIGICLDVLYLGGTNQNTNKKNSAFKAIIRILILMIFVIPLLIF